MRARYDKEVDIAYFYLSETKIVDSDEILPGIVYDFDEDDNVVGIEVLSVRLRDPSEFVELANRADSPLSPQQKEELKEFFRKVPTLA